MLISQLTCWLSKRIPSISWPESPLFLLLSSSWSFVWQGCAVCGYWNAVRGFVVSKAYFEAKMDLLPGQIPTLTTSQAKMTIGNNLLSGTAIFFNTKIIANSKCPALICGMEKEREREGREKRSERERERKRFKEITVYRVHCTTILHLDLISNVRHV